MDEVAPIMDGLMRQQLIQVKKPDLERLELRLNELVGVMCKSFVKLKEQILELEASVNEQGANGLIEKLHRRDGKDITGNDVHLLLTTIKTKNDNRKIREVESKMRMKTSSFEGAIA